MPTPTREFTHMFSGAVGLWYIVTTLCVAWFGPGLGNACGQSDDFNQGNDAAWTHLDPLAVYGAPATDSFPAGGYRIQAASSPSPGQLGPARAGSLREDVTYSDSFRVAVDLIDWGRGQDQAMGVLARVSSPGLGTTNGYAFTYGTGGQDIDINRISGEQPTLLARTQVLGLDPSKLPADERYRLVFAGDGSMLMGTMYLVNVADESDTSNPLGSISATDATYLSGYSGLVTFDNTDTSQGTNGTDVTFDNYAATPLPEPAAPLLLPLATVASLCRRRRRRAT